MLKEKVKKRILDYIKKNGSITYAEIENVMTAAGFEWQGTLCACSDQNQSVIFWEGWNIAALSLVAELMKSGMVSREPCHWLNYLIGGKYLNLPLVKQFTEYQTDHWLPCLFVLGGGKA